MKCYSISRGSRAQRHILSCILCSKLTAFTVVLIKSFRGVKSKAGYLSYTWRRKRTDEHDQTALLGADPQWPQRACADPWGYLLTPGTCADLKRACADPWGPVQTSKGMYWPQRACADIQGHVLTPEGMCRPPLPPEGLCWPSMACADPRGQVLTPEGMSTDSLVYKRSSSWSPRGLPRRESSSPVPATRHPTTAKHRRRCTSIKYGQPRGHFVVPSTQMSSPSRNRLI